MVNLRAGCEDGKAEPDSLGIRRGTGLDVSTKCGSARGGKSEHVSHIPVQDYPFVSTPATSTPLSSLPPTRGGTPSKCWLQALEGLQVGLGLVSGEVLHRDRKNKRDRCGGPGRVGKAPLGAIGKQI